MLPVNGLEVELVGHIEVGRYCLRVTVHHDGFVTRFFDGQQAVYTAVVELDPLTNTVRARAEYDDLLLIRRDTFVLLVEGTVEVWRLCFKLCRTGIYHLVGTAYAQLLTVAGYLLFFYPQYPGNLCIGETYHFQLAHEGFRNILGHVKAHQALLHFHQTLDLLDEPGVDLGQLVDGLTRNSQT